MSGLRECIFHIYLALSGPMLCWAANEVNPYYQYPEQVQYQSENYLNLHDAQDPQLGFGNPIDRQAYSSILQSSEVQAAQIGALVILGGAAIVTGISAANTQRDFNTLKAKFQAVCNALRAAGAVDGEVLSPMTDPVAQEALRKVNQVISGLSNVADSNCNF